MAYQRRRSGTYALTCAKYRRRGRSKDKDPRSCYYNPYEESVLREYVINFLEVALDDPDEWARTCEQQDQVEERRRQIATLEREIAGIEARRRNLLEAIELATAGQDRRDFVARYDQWSDALARRRAELEALQDAAGRIEQVRRGLVAWPEAADELANWSDEQLRPLVRQLIDRIELRAGEPPVIVLAGQGDIT